MSAPTILRDQIVPPRFGGALTFVAPEHRLGFEALIGRIWSEILRRLADPITIKETQTRRSVSVLGFSRYVVDRRNGQLTLQNLSPREKARRFRKVDFLFSADLPLRPTIALFEVLLQEWESEIRGFATHPVDEYDLVETVQRAIRRACLASTRWRVLRHQAREGLALDAEALDLARRSRSNVHHREVTDLHYNDVVEHLAELRRLRDDNPNLLWLYGLARSEGIRLPATNGGLIEALRKRVLENCRVPPAAWRYLANGRRRDFRVALDWLGENAMPNGRWLELREWLRLRVALAIEGAIPLAVQGIFLHDLYKVKADGTAVFFRNTQLPIQTVRLLVREAITRHATGTLRVFAECELADVLVWIRESGICLDENQQKAGWQHLLRRAMDWKHDAALQAQRDELVWTSLIGPHAHADWQVIPVTDVWQLHRASQHYRNCMDNYLRDCMAGNVRMFVVETNSGRRVGAIGIVRRGRKWQLLDVRGFANVLPVTDLSALGGHIAMRYTTLWQTLHPLLEQSASAQVVRPLRVAEDTVQTTAPCENEHEGVDGRDDSNNSDDEVEDICWEEDEGDERRCLVCGENFLETGGECGHLVAAVDYFNGGLYLGALHERMDAVLALVSGYVRRLVQAGCSFSGLGAGFDKVVKEVVRDLDGRDLADDFIGEHAHSIQNALMELVGDHSSVSENDWEFDGNMPGCSTCGRDYWAPDPEAVVGEIIALLVNDEAAARRKSA